MMSSVLKPGYQNSPLLFCLLSLAWFALSSTRCILKGWSNNDFGLLRSYYLSSLVHIIMWLGHTTIKFLLWISTSTITHYTYWSESKFTLLMYIYTFMQTYARFWSHLQKYIYCIIVIDWPSTPLGARWKLISRLMGKCESIRMSVCCNDAALSYKCKGMPT